MSQMSQNVPLFSNEYLQGDWKIWPALKLRFLVGGGVSVWGSGVGKILLVHLPKEKGPLISEFLFALRSCGADAVAGVIVYSEENRFVAGGGGLEAGGHFGADPGFDAVIVDAVREQDGGIFCAVGHVCVGAHGEEAVEAIFGFDAAELGDVGHAVGGGFETEHVGAADLNESGGEKLGPLGDRSADENSAGAAALAGEFCGRGITLFDKKFAAGEKIFPGVGLG